MELVVACPLSVASVVWQPRFGAFAMTVVCKASFRLEPELSSLDSQHDDPIADDAPWGGELGTSLRAASDLVPYKPRADVLLTGHAYGEGGAPFRCVRARLSLAHLDKSIDVWCDRSALLTGDIVEAAPASKVALVYERASIGEGAENPVGMRRDGPLDASGRLPIPNLQPPGSVVSMGSTFFEPVGFGPLAPSWPSRARLGAGFPFRAAPLPEGFDFAAFCAAPGDQQIPFIERVERLELDHLHPGHAHLVTSLPNIRPRVTVERARGAREELPMVCDTLAIDTDEGRCSLVFRGQIALASADEPGRVKVTMTMRSSPRSERRAEDFGPRSVTRELSVSALMAARGGETTLLSPGATKGLPFVAKTTGRARVEESALPAEASAPAQPAAQERLSVTVNLYPDETQKTLLLGDTSPKAEALPFVKTPRAAPASPTFADFRPTAPPELPPRPAWGGPPVPAEAYAIVDDDTFTLDEPSAPTIAFRAPREPIAAAPEPEPEPEPRPAPEPVTLPIEVCAALTARIARTPEDRTTLLEAARIEEEDYQRSEALWQAEIRKAQKRGDRTLLRTYDEAFVGALEADRGAIEASDHARLLVALERGNEAEALEALSLPRAALMPLSRVWLARLTRDEGAARALEAAVDAARQA